MPVFELQLPDQRVLTLEAPDQDTALRGAQEWHQANPIEPSVGGALKQGGVGVGKAMIANAGLMGDLGSLISTGAEKFGIPEGIRSEVARIASQSPNTLIRMMAGPGSQEVKRAVEGVTGEFRKPQNTYEEYADTAGQFLPAAATGPGGLTRRLITQAAIPAIAGETAEQGAKAIGLPELGPYVKAGAAVLSGAGAQKVAGALERSSAVRTLPTAKELKDAAEQGYTQARSLGVEIDPLATGILGQRVAATLEGVGYRDYLAPKTFRALKELETPAGPTAKLADVEGVRRALNTAAADPAERDAARRAIGAIDDYLSNLNPSQVLRGDATKAAGLLTEARGNYAAAKRSEQVGKATGKAELQAASAGSGANIDNATRQQFKAILNNDKKSRGYSPDELDQMRRIVEGTAGGNAARYAGKLAPTGIVSGSLSSGTGALIGSVFGPIGAAAGAVGLPVAGAVAKKIGDASTARQASNLDAMVRARSPLAGANPAQFAATLRNAPPWLRQILLNGLMLRTQLPTPYGINEPR